MKPASLPVAALRSINGWSGALLGGAVFPAYLLAAIVAEARMGRPSPTQYAFALVFGAVPLGLAGAVLGSVLGALVRVVVNRTRFAGPERFPVVLAALALVILGSGLMGYSAVWSNEARHAPRVLESNGTVYRLAGPSSRVPLTVATPLPLFGASTAAADPTAVALEVPPLRWGGEEVVIDIEARGDTLVLRRGGVTVDEVDLRGLDYVRGVHAAVARLDAEREWLAVLVGLRATGRREMLLVYDPEGARVHQELLARTRSGPSPRLWSAGEPDTRQEFALDLGEPLRYVVRQ